MLELSGSRSVLHTRNDANHYSWGRLMVFLHWIFCLHKGEPDQACSPCIKTKSSFNWFWIANAGIELQKHWWAAAGAWEKLESILTYVIFVKQHLCDSVCIRSVHLRTGILYMLGLFSCFAAHFEIWRKKKNSTVENSKSPVSHRWCPGACRAVPCTYTTPWRAWCSSVLLDCFPI